MNNNLIHNPHDKFFRASMEHPKVARDFLRQHLDPEIFNKISFDSLEVEPTSFLDEKLQLTAADVLLKCTFDGEVGFIYILVEHQTKQDPLMPFRLHKYMLRIWDSYHVKSEKEDPRPLPVIFPLVFYTGERPYTGPRTIWDLCGDQSDLMKKILQEPFPLVDLNRIPGKMLWEYNFAGLMESVMRHGFKVFIKDEKRCSEELKEELKEIAQGFENLPIEENDPFLLQLAQYVMAIANLRYTVNDLSKLIENALPPKIGDEIMGLAEKFEKEGMEKGEKIGIEKGREEERIAFAKKMFRFQSDPVIIAEMTNLPLDQVQALQRNHMLCAGLKEGLILTTS